MRRSFFHVQFAVHDRNSASRILQILIFIVSHRDWKNRQQWYQRTVHRSSWSIQEKSRETKTKCSQFFPFVIHFIFTIGDMTDNLLSLTVVSWNEYLEHKWYISKNYCALSNLRSKCALRIRHQDFYCFLWFRLYSSCAHEELTVCLINITYDEKVSLRGSIEDILMKIWWDGRMIRLRMRIKIKLKQLYILFDHEISDDSKCLSIIFVCWIWVLISYIFFLDTYNIILLKWCLSECGTTWSETIQIQREAHELTFRTLCLLRSDSNHSSFMHFFFITQYAMLFICVLNFHSNESMFDWRTSANIYSCKHNCVSL